MKHILFGSDVDDLKIAICIKGTALKRTHLKRFYIEPAMGLESNDFVAYSLAYNDKGKAPAAMAKEYLKELLAEIDEQGINTILMCDPAYFKFATNSRKVDGVTGYAVGCTIVGYEHMSLILCPNYQAMAYKPALQEKIDRSLVALSGQITGFYEEPGKDVIHFEYYPETVEAIALALEELRKHPELTCDIETKGLEFWNCGISSIAFAWDEHNGIAFGVDRELGSDPEEICVWRDPEEARRIRVLLTSFFLGYLGKLTYHNIGFDGKVLVYGLCMKNLQDYEAMIAGIMLFTRKFDDTKLIAYLATNNAVQNELGLKPLSAEFTGNYAEDIKDTTKIPYKSLLRYNLIDCMATWYVKKKYEPILDADDQRELYEGLFKDSVATLMETELCGMPIDPEKVQEAKRQLKAISDECTSFFLGSSIIGDFHKSNLQAKADKKTADAAAAAKTDRATKVYTITDSVIYEEFNPNSNTQLQKLLYDYLEYPVIDLTKSKQPSTGAKTLEKLINHATCAEHVEILNYLIKLSEVSILLTTFIPAFENAQQLPDGSWRVLGNFNLGGTQSLRLSSSNPNLQNIPSHSVFAKIIKDCFRGPTGWLFTGSDFDSLEDKVNALVTKDPNKLAVYTDGFDGHSLRAQAYWPERMPDIVQGDVESINSIAKLYPDERQNSKTPTFALTYSGTFKTLMNNSGFSEAEAKTIEARYHELYKASDNHINEVLETAKKTGWIPLAFGGRIRTPLLAKTVGEGRQVPYAAMAEARSAGNAYTQSYCILTLRAMNEFRKRRWASRHYRTTILPSGTIHDAGYYLCKNSASVMEWYNKNLIECMAWQELPELQHDTIKLSSSLEIFWPSWKSVVKVPNGATAKEIKTICIEAEKKYKEK